MELTRVENILWLIALPAAAECIASVWLPEMELAGFDVKILFLNVSGALLMVRWLLRLRRHA